MYYVLHNSHNWPPQYVLLANDDKQYIHIHTHTHTMRQLWSFLMTNYYTQDLSTSVISNRTQCFSCKPTRSISIIQRKELGFASSCCTRSNRWRDVFPPETGNRPSFPNFVRSNRQPTNPVILHVSKWIFITTTFVYYQLFTTDCCWRHYLRPWCIYIYIYIYISTLLVKFCSQQSVKTLFWLNGSKERVGEGAGNLFLYTPWRHIREVEVHFHLFLTSKPDTGGGLPRNEPLYKQWMGR